MTASVLAKWTSAGRYLSVVFPVYVAAAVLGEREALYYLIVALSCVLAAHQQILLCWGAGWPRRSGTRIAQRRRWC